MIGYRDFGDSKQHEYVGLTENVEEVQTLLDSLQATGGRYPPKDITGALEICAGLEWNSGSRFLIHITDAPCHGKSYHNLIDNYPEGDPNHRVPEELVRKLSDKEIDYYFMKISDRTDTMTKIFARVYLEEKNQVFDVMELKQDTSKFVEAVLRILQEIFYDIPPRR